MDDELEYQEIEDQEEVEAEIESEEETSFDPEDHGYDEINPADAIVDLIQAVQKKDYNSAEDAFNAAINDKLSDQLDQARARLAGQIFNGEEPEEEDLGEFDPSDEELSAEN